MVVWRPVCSMVANSAKRYCRRAFCDVLVLNMYGVYFSAALCRRFIG